MEEEVQPRVLPYRADTTLNTLKPRSTLTITGTDHYGNTIVEVVTPVAPKRFTFDIWHMDYSALVFRRVTVGRYSQVVIQVGRRVFKIALFLGSKS